MESQSCLVFMLPISIALVFVCLSRYLFNSNADDSTEKQLDGAEKLNEQAGLEAYRIREAATESKKSVDVIRERESEARKSVELAESAVGEAHQDNRRAEDILKECLEIIEKAEGKG